MSDEDIQAETTPASGPSPGDIRSWALAALDAENPRPVDAMAFGLVYIGDVLATSITSAIYDLTDQIRGR